MNKMPKKKTEEIKERKRINRKNRYKYIKQNDPEKYAALLEKERERYKKRRQQKKLKSVSEMTDREKRIIRKKWKTNKRNERNMKKIESAPHEVNVIETDDIINTESSSLEQDPLIDMNTVKINKNPYMHSSNSPNKVIAQLRKKINSYRQIIKNLQRKNNTYRVVIHRLKKDRKVKEYPKKTNKAALKEIIKEIQNFYQEDSNSRLGAGKKEFITRKKIKKQKRYLEMTLKNLYNKFVTTHDLKISYSTFCKYRPFWVIFQKNRDTCSCHIHVNMNLIIEALHKEKIIKEKNDYDLINSVCCFPKTDHCLLRICEVCKEKGIIYNEFSNESTIVYSYWCKLKEKMGENEKVKIITTKKKETIKPLELIKKFENNMTGFLKHCFTIEKQYKEMKNLKNSLNMNEAVIHMDWSENYDLKYHEEVQSMHFGSSRRQVSLHTSMLYLYDEITGEKAKQAFCTISKSARHDAVAIWTHLKPILDFIYRINSGIDTLHILTDSPSSQYRNKKMFWIMTQIYKDYSGFLNAMSWNFSESGHGKGAPDGVGAVIKRTSDCFVRLGQDLGTFEDFHHYLKTSIKNIKIEVVNETMITEKSNHLPQKLPSLKGTLSVHQVLWNIFCGSELTARKFSCFECKAGTTCEHGAHLDFFTVPGESEPMNVTVLAAARNMSDNVEFCKSVSTFDKPAGFTLSETNKNLPSSESPYIASAGVSTQIDFEQIVPVSNTNIVTEHNIKDKENILPAVSTNSENEHNLHVADWILIKKSQRSKKHHIARIIGIHGDNVSISILNKTPKGFKWPRSRKRDVITANCIKAILPEPDIDNLLNFHFNTTDGVSF